MRNKSTLIKELIRLQSANVSLIKGVRPRSDRNQSLRSRMREIVNLSLDDGVVETLWESNTKLLGVLFVFQDPVGLNGAKAKMIHFCHEPGSQRAWSWLKRALKRHQKLFDKNTVTTLLGPQRRKLRFFETINLNLNSMIQIGYPVTALKSLRGDPGRTVEEFMSDFKEYGLTCERLKLRGDLLGCMMLFKSFFSKHPEYCFFATDPAYLKAYENELFKHMKSKRSTFFVLKNKNKKVKGYFGTGIHKDDLFGKSAGVELVFSESIQNRGLASFAYRVLLAEMIHQKVNIFKGGTSQPAVLKLGRRMKRWPMAYLLKFGKPDFPREHFFE